MTPRGRSLLYRDLPDNLEPDPHKQGDGSTVVYYRYKFPDGKRKSLGRDRGIAIEAAKALNAKFSSDATKELLAKVLGSDSPRAPAKDNPPLSTVITEFEKHYLPGRDYSERSTEEIGYKLALYGREWGNQLVKSFTTLQVAGFLNGLSVSAYIKHRKLLIDLFSYAGHSGYITTNPVAMTLEKSDSERKKQRQRHTLDGYMQIRAIAPDWLQRAMDIALRTLQRRGDLTRLHRDQLHGDCIRILQRKTRSYKRPVFIDIQMGVELKEAVTACQRSGVPCPYLIHYRPKKITRQIREAKLHPFAVTDDHLSKEFARYRDAANAYPDLAPSQRPSFHDLRALGTHLYQAAGYSNEYIMALTGHASEQMLENYLEGHKDPVPLLVRADLKVTS